MAAPEQLKGIGDLLEANKEGKDSGLDMNVLKNQVSNAYSQAEGNIKALEEQLKLEKNALDQESLDKKHAETIKGLRGELTRIKAAIDARLAKLPEERKMKQQAEMEGKLREAVHKTDPKAFEEVLKQQGVDEFKDDVVKDHGLAYYQAMFRMGKGDDAIKAIKKAYDNGGRSYLGITDHYVSDDLLKASAKLENTDASEYTFLKDLSVRPDRTSYYVATLMTEASKVFGKGSSHIKEYGVYLSKQFNDPDSELKKGLKKNKVENDKKPDNKFIDAEHQLLVRHLKTPSEWLDSQKSQGNSKPPEVAPAPTPIPGITPAPVPGPAPKPPEQTGPSAFDAFDPDLIIEKAEKEAKARTTYAKKTEAYAANWDTIFGAGSMVEGLKKEQVAGMPKNVVEMKNNEYVVKTTPEALKAFTDKMDAAIRNAYVGRLEQYVKHWDLMIGKDQKDPRGSDKAGWEQALATEQSRTAYGENYPAEVAGHSAYLDQQLVKVPEKLSEKEAADRTDFAAKLDAYVARMKICAVASSQPESFDALIKKAEDQKAKVLEQNGGKYTIPFDVAAIPAYMDERRAEGKNFLISCKENLDKHAQAFTNSVELTEALKSQIAEFDAFIGQDFETIDADRLQKAITRYTQQINNIRTFRGFDTLDQERADAKKPELKDTPEQAEARKKALAAGKPFVNVKQALDRGLVVINKDRPNEVNPKPGYEFVDDTDDYNKAVKPKAGTNVPPPPISPAPAPAPAPKPGPDGSGKKAPPEGKDRPAVTPEKARLYVSNFLFENKLSVVGFNELIKSDINDDKKAPETLKAIKELQKKLGVKVDGLFGPATYAKLPEADKVKLGDKKPENKPETEKDRMDQFEKDKQAMREVFGDDITHEIEKLLKKHYSVEKGFDKSIVELMKDPELVVLGEKIQKRFDSFFDQAKEKGEFKNSMFSIKHLGDDVFEFNMNANILNLSKKYTNLGWTGETMYLKRTNGIYRKIDKPTTESSKTSAVWDSFEQGTPMFDRLNALPADTQKKFKDTVGKMVHANDDIRRAGITGKVTPVELDGVTFEVTMKKTDGTSNENCSWSIRGEKTVISNMNMWLLERMEKQVKNPDEAPSAETKLVDSVDGLPSALEERYNRLTLNQKDRYKTYLRDSASAQARVRNGEPVLSNQSVDHPARVYKDESGKLRWTEGVARTADEAKAHTYIPDLNEWYMKKIESERGADRATYETKFSKTLDETIKRAKERSESNHSDWPVLTGGPFGESLEKANAFITYTDGKQGFKIGTMAYTDEAKFKEDLVKKALDHYDGK